MKTLMMVLALAGLMVPMAGCETLADTPAENAVRIKHAMALNLRQMNNDIQYILYIDRPVWLSRYPIPND
jgi:hypothetical protein